MLLFSCGESQLSWDIERREIKQKIVLGMSEDDVRDKFGKPQYEYTKENAPKNYYIDGYSNKKRYISNKVLIYIFTEPIAYIWINDKGKVEEFYVGGS